MTAAATFKSLDNLAKHVSERAAHKDTPFSETLDAFKALTAYYALLLKNKGDSEDAPGVPDAFDFATGIATEAENGGRISRRRSS